MKILFTGGVPDWVERRLNTLGHTLSVVAADAYIDEAKFSEAIKGINVYVSGGIEQCTKTVIEAADALKAIVFLGVDYKAYIDADAAAKKKIPIFNTPGANARAVAELTLMLMLMTARSAAQMVIDIQKKSWEARTGFELQGKTLGILGGGVIAGHVSHLGLGMGMNIIYWSRSGPRKTMTGQYKSYESVISECDVLSLHMPHEAGTIVDRTALDKMKPHAHIVNTSPAQLVEAAALYDALKNKRLASAAFDSFYVEGHSAWNCPEARLFDLAPGKFTIMPHAGWRTHEADRNMFQSAIDCINKL